MAMPRARARASVFRFNVSSYLTFGEGASVRVVNATDSSGHDVNVSVIWNATGGYATLGAGVGVVGAVLAKGSVSTGVNSTLSGPSNTYGGGVYSVMSHVSIGASAIVDNRGRCWSH